jgi:5-methyltetrahydropteroyltriglutamate--homocysteine methyltransferase
MTAASPGVITNFVDDLYYRSHDAYLAALAEAMRVEFEAIHAAGLILQLDCPDLGSGRHNRFKDLSEAEFLKLAAANLEALDTATVNIPSEAMRLHICWGNYEGPHTRDIELGAIFGLLAKARPQAISFEAANPRHEWEWEALAGLDITDDTVLIPGVVDSTTNFVEHERLVAQRILNFARVVGRERVIAGADCGFATFAGRDPQVAPSIVWAKFRSLAAGARLASEALWP